MRRFARFVGSLLDAVLPPRDTARIVRACDDGSFDALFSPRADERGVVSLLPYRHRLVRAAVLEAKFRDNRRAQALLARVLADYLAALPDEYALEGGDFAVVPVPLSPRRRAARGYNQVERVLEASGTPYTHALERVRDTAAQTTLGRTARLRNMEGAFRARTELDPRVRYVLLDDVATTGATLAAAECALRAAGAVRIVPLALAR